MAAKEPVTRINVKQGPAKGKRYTLKNDINRIGSDPSCDIAIKGSYVSPEHAIVTRREDGLWIVQNKSINRTLVNQQAIDMRQLETGDLIQVGAETLLEFEILQKKEKERKKRVKREKGTAVAGLLKRPGLVLGFAFYIFVLIAGGLYLGSATEESEGPALTARDAEDALARTKSFFSSQEFLEASNSIAGSAGISNLSEDSLNYYELVSLLNDGSASSGIQAKELIQKILDEAQGRLTLAWHYEEQERWKNAIAAYQDVIAMIPDIRVPLVKLAVRRIQVLEQFVEEEE